MRSVEHIKRYTTIGTAHDQGKTSGVIASGITAELLGVSIETLGTTTFRPVHPGRVRRAGRARLGRAVRPRAHHGAARLACRPGRGVRGRRAVETPRYYPLPGEGMDAAVLRECAAVSAFTHGSTLGTIDVSGRDAAELLDRSAPT
jgi:sarcosine oxidase subunit alpha